MTPLSPSSSPTVLTIPMPEYDLSRPLDYEQLGGHIDRLVLASFPDGDYVDRSIGSQEHPGKSVPALVALTQAARSAPCTCAPPFCFRSK